ncbi:hypothetical protein FHR83_007073 [Actinoplanes campanulatus]|uniref:Uncharacterized protein n=1 Tax=Actinoplanes campanulatus TaxID=113559 RepID=A0A7W5ANP3_9ACTN|nr:hypothetical protein [Actinoplanes campanulatus]MBB3099367.1 hypothetical protein [Actinoplanes campanulatus]GGN40267.1 hypothetical protein GCM10010109_69190 [Actinoplanes campanulatus]GID42424.1 hypothetical protein Aca09nite_89300 [Actinoplanes campanulatus]
MTDIEIAVIDQPVNGKTEAALVGYVEPAHPDDILVVAWIREATDFPQFRDNQVYSTNAAERLLGRRFRHVYVTPNAFTTDTKHSERFWAELERVVRQRGGRFYHIEQYDTITYAEHELARQEAEILDQAEAAGITQAASL